MPLSSPDHLNGTDNDPDNIWTEQLPSDTAEMALTEELSQVQVRQCGVSSKCLSRSLTCHCLIISPNPHQEQACRAQTQFNEEELKNSKLSQQITKLEEQIALMSEECDRKDEVESLCVPPFRFCPVKVM